MGIEHIVDIITLILLLSVVIDNERNKARLEKRIEKLERDSDGRE